MALENRDWSEKRNFIRMKINTPVQVTSDAGRFEATCKDLSGSGMLVDADRELPLGSTVELTIEQEGDKRLPFQASAEVVRSEAAGSGRFTLGFAITSIQD